MTQRLIDLLESRPIATGLFGAIAGWFTAIMNHMRLIGEIAGVFGAIFGSISAFFAMILVIRKFINDKKASK